MTGKFLLVDHRDLLPELCKHHGVTKLSELDPRHFSSDWIQVGVRFGKKTSRNFPMELKEDLEKILKRKVGVWFEDACLDAGFDHMFDGRIVLYDEGSAAPATV